MSPLRIISEFLRLRCVALLGTVYDGIVECIEAEQSGVPEMKSVTDLLTNRNFWLFPLSEKAPGLEQN